MPSIIDTTATPTTPSPTPRPTPQPTAQSTTRPDPPAVAGITPDRPVAASPAVPDRLGQEWNVTEAVTFTGRWVRRGDSDAWDATWNNGAVAVLSISIAGAKVRISRRDVGGPAIGLAGTYEGTLAADGTLQGTETVTWPGHFTNQVQSWQGRIVK